MPLMNRLLCRNCCSVNTGWNGSPERNGLIFPSVNAVLELKCFHIHASVFPTCMSQVTEDGILDIMERVLQSPQSTQCTREYTFNAVMKLSTRLVFSHVLSPEQSFVLTTVTENVITTGLFRLNLNPEVSSYLKITIMYHFNLS